MHKIATLVLLALAATAPAETGAQNVTERYGMALFFNEKDRIDQEIGRTHAIAKIFNCSYIRCEKRIAEWYIPERNLYVRLEGSGAAATRLTYGPVCESRDCRLVAELTEGK